MTDYLAKRQTADARTVYLWLDGTVSDRWGVRVRGVGIARLRFRRESDLAAAWAVMGEVCLFDWDELPVVFRAVREDFLGRRRTGGLDPLPAEVREVACRALKGAA